MITSKNEHVFIPDLSKFTLRIIFDDQWASMNVVRKGLLLGKIRVMCLCGDSIYTVELRSLAAPASYVLFVIKFFAIHPNMEPAEWGNTCWQKHTSHS